jgi:hypothetical protein
MAFDKMALHLVMRQPDDGNDGAADVAEVVARARWPMPCPPAAWSWATPPAGNSRRVRRPAGR